MTQKAQSTGQEAAPARMRRPGILGAATGFALLPNVITLCALGCGFYSLAASWRGDCRQGGLAILVAALLDALDGWVARRVGSTSRLGRDLDCVSDFVGFCLAPPVLVAALQTGPIGRGGWAVLVFYGACGAWRLVRYRRQSDTAEKSGFTGLPTTGAALLLAGGALASRAGSGLPEAGLWVLPVLGLLMVSTIPFRPAGALLGQRVTRSGLLVTAIGVAFLVVSVRIPVVILAVAAAYILWGIIEGLLSLAGVKTGGSEVSG